MSERRPPIGLLRFVVGTLVVAGSAWWWFQLAALGRLGNETGTMPFVLLVGLFAAAQLIKAAIELRGETYHVDPSEAVLILGLVFADPLAVLVARLATALVVQLRQRVPPLKIAFNLATFSIEIGVALVLYVGVLGDASAISPRGWLAAGVALIGGQVITSALVSGIIALANRELDVRPEQFLLLWLISAVNSAVALLALYVAWVDWRALWLVVALIGSISVGYRSFLRIRQRYGSLDLLYRFTDRLTGATETDEVTRLTLSLARDLLRAGEAALVIELADGVVVRRMGASGQIEAATRRGTPETVAEVALVELPESVVVPAGEVGTVGRVLADRLGWTDFACAPLGRDADGAGSRGVLVVADRLADSSTFDRDDLRLLETFAHHSTTALRVGELVEELRREVAEKEYQGLHDALTGLPNRQSLLERTDGLIAAADGAPVAMLFMDVDGFKEVNDALGHHIGDILLVEVAKRLGRTVGKRGMLARLGGDEFAVVMHDVTQLNDALVLARELCAAAERPFFLDQLTLEVGISIGVAVAPEHAPDARTLFQRADVAMYLAKAQRSGVEVYDAAHDHSSTRRLSLVGDLRHALEHDELTLAYQPQTNLVTGEAIGVEALARWTHPTLGFVSPDEFIPIAEQTGMVHGLTRWALRTALADLATWRRRWPDLRMSVNMSTRNLTDPSFVQDVAEIVAASGVPPEALTLELTESTVMNDPQRSIVVLGELHELGVRLAIDDFGTGYSSLQYLKRLPVDEVKIDKSFVMHMAADADDTVIVRSTIDLGHNLGLHAVAEGVEDQETWNVLLALGCDYAQGYFMSRPLQREALVEWLEAREAVVSGPAAPVDRSDEQRIGTAR